MALVESVSIDLGTEMPDFKLKDTAGADHDGREAFGENGLLVAFTCNHCPYAIAVWPRLISLGMKASALGIETVAINPNINPAYPDDAPDKMVEKVAEWQIPFPYLIDQTQQTAKDFKAQCTPDLYLFDSERKLVYHGRIDDNWQDASKVTAKDLEAAVEALSSGENPAADQKPSMGCSIKWK